MIKLQTTLVTSFHKGLAGPEWVAALESFVTERIRSTGGFKSTEGTGTVSSRYNEERYMGPLSVVKFRFDVDVRVARSDPAAEPDRYQTSVEYDPEAARFSVPFRGEHVSTAETRGEFAAKLRKDKEAWIASLDPLKPKGDFERRRCSVCSGPFRARFYPEGRSWSHACAREPSHEWSTWLGVRLEPGGWWTDFVADRTCPRCASSKRVVGLLYGLILMEVDPEVWELGGCSLSPNLWHCRDCAFDFAQGLRETR